MPPDKQLAEYLSGTLPPDECAAFEEQLLENPDALRAIVEQRRMDAALRGFLDPHSERLEAAIMTGILSASDEAVEESVLQDTVRAARSEPAAWHRAGWWCKWAYVTAASVLGLLLAGMALWPWMSGRNRSVPVLRAVASVTQSVNARWAPESRKPRTGEVLDSGLLVLESGLVQLEFATGAVVAVEGPARFTLADFNSLRLIEGRLSADMPKPAVGFTVQTPHATVVDLGTRFGVWARANGGSETHVFSGKVRLTPDGKDGQEVSRGQAALVKPDGVVVKSSAKSDYFPGIGQALTVHPKDCGFESLAALHSGSIPTNVGQWLGVGGIVTGARQGIRPHAQNLMLCFQRPDARAPKTVGPEVAEFWQLVDLAPYRETFAGGPLSISWSGMFNRIAGGTDRFGVTLAAFRGTPGQAPALWKNRQQTALAVAEKEQRMDADPSTWEKVEVIASVSPDAEFLLVGIRAIGPASRTLRDPFPGHFADTAVLKFVKPLQPAGNKATP